MPQLVQKFYAIRDERAVRRGMIASTAFALLIAGAAYFTGAAARLFLTPENAPGGLRRREARFRRPDARVPGQGRPAVALRADDAPHPVRLHVDPGRPGPHLELLGRQGPLRRFRQPGRHRPDTDPDDARRLGRLRPPLRRPGLFPSGEHRRHPVGVLGRDRLVLPGTVRLGAHQPEGDQVRRHRVGRPGPGDVPGPFPLGPGAGGGGLDRDDRLVRVQSSTQPYRRDRPSQYCLEGCAARRDCPLSR